MGASSGQMRTPTEQIPALEEAFIRFNEASARLEERYAALHQETESLRAQLQEKDLEVKRAERLSTLGEMASAIAHEVRNPLGAIKLFLSVLGDDLQDRPDSLALVRQIDASVGTLDHIVSNILQFSKVHKAQLFAVNLHSLIQEQVLRVRAEWAGIEVQVSLEGPKFIQGNEHGLRQVFSNILLNACQAMRQKGVINISVKPAGEKAIEVVIADNGPGIPEHLLSKIFDPFVTSKNEGTGLGLAIVRQILAHHGATVSVRNCPGAEFKICFPL